MGYNLVRYDSGDMWQWRNSFENLNHNPELSTMKNLSFIINLAIVFGISVELVLILFGKLSADQLLISSGLSGLLILVSVKLLKDALTNLFGLTESQKEVIKNEINVMDEIDAHITWKVGLQNYLDGKSKAEFNLDQIMSDNQSSAGPSSSRRRNSAPSASATVRRTSSMTGKPA